MSPKEKAKELYQRFIPWDVEMCDPLGQILEGYLERHARNCAIMCVEEIIKLPYYTESQLEYWYDVKTELENA